MSSTTHTAAPTVKFSALDTQKSAATIKFDFEEFIKKEFNLNIDHIPETQTPYSVNDGKVGVCTFFLRGHCYKGNNCIFRHLTREESERMRSDIRTIVCKHWVRGLCKKGDMCDFLHEYNLKKMPECQFYEKTGLCNNREECFYRHTNPNANIKECPWYARGFCKHGAKCRSKHERKLICQHYRFGFCPLGPNCKDEHPSFDLPVMNAAATAAAANANANANAQDPGNAATAAGAPAMHPTMQMMHAQAQHPQS
ncbi:Cleavage and polyadenylation specificity factor subunit 4 [Coemansia sp. IMI 203386]|nr:Cleavage and polyadenylation specificity factor subunit 4 [Coemansia sp. IMI 203386]